MNTPQNSSSIEKKTLPKVRGSYRFDTTLAKSNWFNVGGKADILFKPEDDADLSFFLKNIEPDTKITILGVGSNLLVRDGGIDGVVIKLGRNFATIKHDGTLIHAGAGALDFNVANYAANEGLEGLEFLVGIPGTIGGALFMNAGAYGNDISQILGYAQAIDREGNIIHLNCQDIGYGYRSHSLSKQIFFTKAVLKAQQGDKQEIAKRLKHIVGERENTQPVRSKTSGSTFKNPPGHKAWQLIDQAGCRGLTVGGAQVSEKHCNFFINTGNASAKDIEMLGEEVRQKVLTATGVQLEWELSIIGKHQ